MSEPAFWRVTLTWPRPPSWENPSSVAVRFTLADPEVFRERFASQLPKGSLEVAELRPRSVAVVAKVPAKPARIRNYQHGYATSAQRAIEQVVNAAQFGAVCVGAVLDIDAPLPEPVRIKIEAALT